MNPIKALPKIYRKDKFVNSLYDGGVSAVKVESDDNKANYNNIFFDSLNEYGASNYEYDLAIEPLADIIDRRTSIKSKWKAFVKCSINSLQSLANLYFYNDVKVSYDGNATVTYTARIGFKNKYSDNTYNAWYSDNSVVFPAHMQMQWVYETNRWRDYYTSLNWGKAKERYHWNNINMNWETAKTAERIGKTWEYMNTITWDDTLHEEIEY